MTEKVLIWESCVGFCTTVAGKRKKLQVLIKTFAVGKRIPCKSTISLGAFDELLKAHFIFGTMYNQMLHKMYTFTQTTIYNIPIDIGQVQESPHFAEVRTRLLH